MQKCHSYVKHFISRRTVDFSVKESRHELKFFTFYAALYLVARRSRRSFRHCYGFTRFQENSFELLQLYKNNRTTQLQKKENAKSTMIFLYSRSAENIFRLQELIFRSTHTLSTRSGKVASQLVQKVQPRFECCQK